MHAERAPWSLIVPGIVVPAVVWGLMIGFASHSWPFGVAAGVLVGGANHLMARRRQRKLRRER